MGMFKLLKEMGVGVTVKLDGLLGLNLGVMDTLCCCCSMASACVRWVEDVGGRQPCSSIHQAPLRPGTFAQCS